MRVSLPVLDPRSADEPAWPGAARHLIWGAECNLGCEFCRKQLLATESLDGRPLARDAEIVVTGGEPLLVPDLLRRLRSASVRAVLETNGALLHAPDNVRRLASVGVRGVRMFLPGWDGASTDRIARVEAIAALQEQAARNLIDAGLGLAFVVPVSEEHSARLSDWLSRAEQLALGRPRERPLEVYLAYMIAPDRQPSRALELALGRLALDAIRRNMLVRFDGPLAPAPCRFERPEAFASLFAGPHEPRVKPGACAACALVDSCRGPAHGVSVAPLAAHGRPPEAFESCLRVLGEADRVQDWVRAGESHRWGRENFVSVGSEPDVPTGKSVRSALIRAFFHCNEDCTFCWVDLEQPSVPDQAIGQVLALMALEGMRALTVTGGEPTLDKRLESQIRLARALGTTQLTLQTNAVRLDDPRRARALAEAGLTHAFVSLHAAGSATNDAITRSRGNFERTLNGIRNLLEAGVSVGVGIVFTHENCDQARELILLIGGPLRGVDLTLSVAQSMNDRLDARRVAPRYTDLAPSLRQAAHTAHELGVRFTGLLGQCGIPPCILDADPICFPELDVDHPEWSAPQDFVHAEACESCSLRRKCPGLRASYARAYGTGELRPV
jgi:MoaA/NifB/PqqE/SkfB family radical SAM enzyme